MNLTKHALATVELYPDPRRGSDNPLLPGLWKADIAIGDIRRAQYGFGTILEEPLGPGEIRTIFLTFRRPEIVIPLLSRGLKFFYCNIHAIGEGHIIDFSPDGLKDD